MKKRLTEVVVAVAAGTTLIAAPAVPMAQAMADQGPEDATAESESDTSTLTYKTQLVTQDKVEGDFSYNQSELSSLSEVARALGKSAAYLCNSLYTTSADDSAAESSEWTIHIGGDVESSIDATLEELSKTGSAKVVMGCTCLGNPAGGTSAINAEVEGVSFRALMSQVGVSREANTVVFTSNDGYEIALPLGYVKQRYSVIAYGVNGSSLEEVTGSHNQLWLGSTPGSYFLRDVTAITFETRQTPPPNPYTPEGDDYYGNFPNIGLTKAE